METINDEFRATEEEIESVEEKCKTLVVDECKCNDELQKLLVILMYSSS
jgi:hypothetical protein